MSKAEKKHIVVEDFNCNEGTNKAFFQKGDDVSHLDEARLKELVARKLVKAETVTETKAN